MDNLANLKSKVRQYQSVLKNTLDYRKAWKDGLCEEIKNSLQEMVDQTGLNAEIELKSEVENLDAIVLSLGDVKSGLFQKVSDDIRRDLLKNNGSLVYQQLFNGKLIVLINYPVIEGLGQPQPPKAIGIYRPEEIKTPFLVRHMEEFMKEITNWEDYDDDDDPHKNQQGIGFNMNFSLPKEEEEL